MTPNHVVQPTGCKRPAAALRTLTLMLRCKAAFAWLFPLVACSEPTEPSRDITVPDFSCLTGAYAVTLPPKLVDLRKLAKLEREVKGRPGNGPGWEDYRVLHFRNLKVAVTADPLRGTYALEGIHVTGSEWRVSGALQIGLPGVELLRPLGVTRPADGVWRLWRPGPEEAKITLVDGKITAVSYSCYTG